MEIIDVYIPCRTCGKLIPAGGENYCLTCRLLRLVLEPKAETWMPVSMGLPKSGEKVLCFWHGIEWIATWDLVGDEKWCDGYLLAEKYEVSHWMPLPAPPKEVTE